MNKSHITFKVKTIRFQIKVHVLLIILLVSSCTIEKRIFNRGYHVAWNRKSKEISASSIDKSLGQANVTIVSNNVDVNKSKDSIRMSVVENQQSDTVLIVSESKSMEHQTAQRSQKKQLLPKFIQSSLKKHHQSKKETKIGKNEGKAWLQVIIGILLIGIALLFSTFGLSGLILTFFFGLIGLAFLLVGTFTLIY